MICPSCKNGRTKVKASTPYVEDGQGKILRERVCEDCDYKFRTIEKTADKQENQS